MKKGGDEKVGKTTQKAHIQWPLYISAAHSHSHFSHCVPLLCSKFVVDVVVVVVFDESSRIKKENTKFKYVHRYIVE